jgi:hypothetical protein
MVHFTSVLISAVALELGKPAAAAIAGTTRPITMTMRTSFFMFGSFLFELD